MSGLESARYAEVGAEYAKLSGLLIQQRTARRVAGAAAGQEWDELSRLAQRALDLLDPLLGAARLLATTPASVATSAPAARRTVQGPAAGPGSRSTRVRTATTPPATTPPAPRAATKRS
ncbi:hypothetical protein [Blastococcus brunescens]|uniref:Uncharacterized protein n=1 Tax=Blastococcus brunescens TaxID=1564165 RepID=A0ABZ1B604_9ACTN|nr:hypothetical protein [Blastococcus sp. BMG 8361]WRL66232.1 hypothetical protein U6N30_12605 [Blastococcus sp. BMG 8361]